MGIDMEMHRHSLESLFEQLGLPHTAKDIESFIQKNSPLLDQTLPIHRASFWNDSQSAFLKEAKKEDADWVEVVDQLDVLLRTSEH
ncbi:hypothetical protein FM109_06175 [Vibrio casei]|nr:hypothetical protein FM109_06175 [Vibrio casei]